MRVMGLMANATVNGRISTRRSIANWLVSTSGPIDSEHSIICDRIAMRKLAALKSGTLGVGRGSTCNSTNSSPTFQSELRSTVFALHSMVPSTVEQHHDNRVALAIFGQGARI